MTKKGKISSLRRKLLITFESVVGESCYNGNIQNYGPGGEWDGEGRSFRYPITFIGADRRGIKRWYTDDLNVPDAVLLNGHYKFGANELHIMYALNQILDMLEEVTGM